LRLLGKPILTGHAPDFDESQTDEVTLSVAITKSMHITSDRKKQAYHLRVVPFEECLDRQRCGMADLTREPGVVANFVA